MADIRREYSHGSLRRADLDANPMAQFRSGSHRRRRLRRAVAGAKSASRFSNSGTPFSATRRRTRTQWCWPRWTRMARPSARTVLLKGVDERGFIFYTNYDSRKGRELAENPNAALTFYWPDLERQVCVAGHGGKNFARRIGKVFQESSARKPTGGLGVKPKRRGRRSRRRWKRNGTKWQHSFPGDVPLPPNWGGFVLKPERIEFWQGRPSRLHDRFQYTRQPDNSWKLERLAP